MLFVFKFVEFLNQELWLEYETISKQILNFNLDINKIVCLHTVQIYFITF